MEPPRGAGVYAISDAAPAETASAPRARPTDAFSSANFWAAFGIVPAPVAGTNTSAVWTFAVAEGALRRPTNRANERRDYQGREGARPPAAKELAREVGRPCKSPPRRWIP